MPFFNKNIFVDDRSGPIIDPEDRKLRIDVFKYRFGQRVHLDKVCGCGCGSATVQSVTGPTSARGKCDNCSQPVEIG